jgi:hypothetical protein
MNSFKINKKIIYIYKIVFFYKIIMNKSVNKSMNKQKKFIDEQIQLYGNQKFNVNELSEKYKSRFLIIKIINNTIQTTSKYDIRGERMIDFMKLLVKKYKLDDTTLFINLADGVYYSSDDVPVFNFSVPYGVKGLIMPEFDIMVVRKNKNETLNVAKNRIEKYNPKNVLNDIYFVGSESTIRKNKIREKLSGEKYPFHVDLSGSTKVEMWEFKNHKYLLDLPGFKPWSIRFKFLLFMARVIFRISFYNPKYETGLWRLWFDYLIKPNRDYIQLTYLINYEDPLDPKVYQQIKSDILKVYNYFEKNQKKYDKMVKNATIASKNITLDESLSYMYHLIQSYTKKLIIKKIL